MRTPKRIRVEASLGEGDHVEVRKMTPEHYGYPQGLSQVLSGEWAEGAIQGDGTANFAPVP